MVVFPGISIRAMCTAFGEIFRTKREIILTDGVLDMLYPGYQDSSYFRDERGFLTATPYGDSADCLLSDAPPWAAGALRRDRLWGAN